MGTNAQLMQPGAGSGVGSGAPAAPNVTSAPSTSQTPKPRPTKPQTVPATKPTQSAAASALCSFISARFRELAADRYSEDRLWYKSGLFNLGFHWLKKGGATIGGQSTVAPMNSGDFGDRWTAPVTDHFSKTVAANSNSLGANLPRVTALSGNYDARSRRAAAYAEAVFDTANRESGMDILNPILAQQEALWGIAWTKDEVAFDLSTEDIPILADGEAAPPAPATGAQPAAPAPETVDPQSGEPTDAPAATVPPAADPAAAASPDLTPSPLVIGTERVPAPRLRTTLPSPFAVYIPRDCGDPNLTPELYERVVFRLGEAREMFPDYAAILTADGGTTAGTGYSDASTSSLAAYYQAQLQRLSGRLSTGASTGTISQSATSVGSGSNSSAGSASTTVQYLTAIEGWVDWQTLPRETQQAIESEWGDQPSVVEEYASRGMTRLSAAVAYGVYGIAWQDTLLQFGENPNHGDTPHTAFMWEKNALNPYGNFGLGRVLMPLQRQLNQLDAIHLRQLQSTGTTKIFLPESQQFDLPSGDPVDVFRYDDMMGKEKPQLFPAGNAGGIPEKRAQIVAEFGQLGYTEGVASGASPAGVDSFRGIAYLGAKAEEQRGTQRALWEQSHTRRSRKILRMARRVWTEPRKIKVAGPNNRFGAELIEGADLDFETDQITVVTGSSKPKTLQDRLDAITTLAAVPGLLDWSDPDLRQYILDSVGMPELSLANSLQYDKADRDLQQVLDGVQPVSSPYQDFTIVARAIGEYTLTEEYEGLPPAKQASLLGYMTWCQQVSAPPVPPMGVPPELGGAKPGAGAGPGGAPNPTTNPGGTLSKTPGKSAPTKNVETASKSEGNAVASSVDNSATPYSL